MSFTPEQLDAYHERIGIKPSRHPFTPGGGKNGQPTTGCLMCPYSAGHATHQPAEVISLAQFRDRKRS